MEGRRESCEGGTATRAEVAFTTVKASTTCSCTLACERDCYLGVATATGMHDTVMYLVHGRQCSPEVNAPASSASCGCMVGVPAAAAVAAASLGYSAYRET